MVVDAEEADVNQASDMIQSKLDKYRTADAAVGGQVFNEAHPAGLPLHQEDAAKQVQERKILRVPERVADGDGATQRFQQHALHHLP